MPGIQLRKLGHFAEALVEWKAGRKYQYLSNDTVQKMTQYIEVLEGFELTPEVTKVLAQYVAMRDAGPPHPDDEHLHTELLNRVARRLCDALYDLAFLDPLEEAAHQAAEAIAAPDEKHVF